jgi:hypothetical protein
VLESISELTQNICFLTISLKKSKKTLSDGRNAHLIVQTRNFWLAKINKIFNNFTIIDEMYLIDSYLNLVIKKNL